MGLPASLKNGSKTCWDSHQKSHKSALVSRRSWETRILSLHSDAARISSAMAPRITISIIPTGSLAVLLWACLSLEAAAAQVPPSGVDTSTIVRLTATTNKDCPNATTSLGVYSVYPAPNKVVGMIGVTVAASSTTTTISSCRSTSSSSTLFYNTAPTGHEQQQEEEQSLAMSEHDVHIATAQGGGLLPLQPLPPYQNATACCSESQAAGGSVVLEAFPYPSSCLPTGSAPNNSTTGGNNSPVTAEPTERTTTMTTSNAAAAGETITTTTTGASTESPANPPTRATGQASPSSSAASGAGAGGHGMTTVVTNKSTCTSESSSSPRASGLVIVTSTIAVPYNIPKASSSTGGSRNANLRAGPAGPAGLGALVGLLVILLF